MPAQRNEIQKKPMRRLKKSKEATFSGVTGDKKPWNFLHKNDE
jgi:hypothetical protein